MKNNNIKFIAIISLLLLVLMCSCTRRNTIIERFEVEEGDFLSLPVKHFRFPYPQTNIFIDFNPSITNHPSRDFSDIITVKVYGKNGEIVPVKQIYDLNGAGKNIEISFVNKKAKITKLEILFNEKCSGTIEIVSWQPL